MMRRCKCLSIFFACLLLGWTQPGGAQEQRQEERQQERPIIIKELAVEGNRRVQDAVILGRVQTKIGAPFVPAPLREDVKAIFALGFFDDVQLKVEDFEGGIKVTFVVVERPLVRDVSFEGNKAVKTEELQEKADLRIGVLYNPVDIQVAEERVRARYEELGYFRAKVTPITERTPDGDVRVVFRIDEGRKMKIDHIEFIGNRALSASKLKGVMKTREREYFIFRGTVQRKDFEDDIDRILALYADHGYIQARVESHEIVVDEATNRLILRIRLVEGPQFRFGKIGVSGNQVLPVGEIRRQIRIKGGEVFSRKDLRQDVSAITELYSAIGRAFAEVTPETTTETETRKIDVTFAIKEGPEVYVERINISGNTKSSEKVLRRELRLAEGDLFSIQKVIRSRQRLFNLGFFDEVSVTTAPGSSLDKIVVNVDVKERPTGLFSVGAGFSSLDRLVGTFDISQQNLFGRGQELALRGRVGSRSQLLNLGFTEPYLFDMPLSAGFDIFDSLRLFNDFSRRGVGGDLRFSYPFTEFIRGFGTYKLERVKVFDVSAGASSALREAEGTSTTSSVTFSGVRDSRDNVFEPTRGSRNSLSLETAGLGGDNRFFKVIGESAWFFPLPFFGWVIGVRGEAGVAEGFGGEDVPLFERFFLGGPNTLRGQATRSVSPRDATGARIGGDKELLFNTELLIPLIARFRGALFFDAGNAYGFGKDFDPTDLRTSAGVGFRWFSPFGPVRVDYGINLDRQPGEKSAQFHFAIGSTF